MGKLFELEIRHDGIKRLLRATTNTHASPLGQEIGKQPIAVA